MNVFADDISWPKLKKEKENKIKRLVDAEEVRSYGGKNVGNVYVCLISDSFVRQVTCAIFRFGLELLVKTSWEEESIDGSLIIESVIRLLAYLASGFHGRDVSLYIGVSRDIRYRYRLGTASQDKDLCPTYFPSFFYSSLTRFSYNITAFSNWFYFLRIFHKILNRKFMNVYEKEVNPLQPKEFGVKFSLREIGRIFFTKILRNFKLFKMPKS